MPTAEKKQLLTVPFEVKATDDEAHSFEGYASTWDIDQGWDQIKKGAFKRTISNWKSAKRQVPMIDGHGSDPWSGPRMDDIVGGFDLIGEDEVGLRVKGMPLVDDPRGDRAYRLVKAGLLWQMSIGYNALDYSFKEHPDVEGAKIRVLEQIKLLEISLVFQPMNPNATIDSVKSLLADDARLEAFLQDATPEQVKRLHERAAALLQADEAKDGLATDAPERIQLEERIRDITLRGLVTRL